MNRGECRSCFLFLGTMFRTRKKKKNSVLRMILLHFCKSHKANDTTTTTSLLYLATIYPHNRRPAWMVRCIFCKIIHTPMYFQPAAIRRIMRSQIFALYQLHNNVGYCLVFYICWILVDSHPFMCNGFNYNLVMYSRKCSCSILGESNKSKINQK